MSCEKAPARLHPFFQPSREEFEASSVSFQPHPLPSYPSFQSVRLYFSLLRLLAGSLRARATGIQHQLLSHCSDSLAPHPSILQLQSPLEQQQERHASTSTVIVTVAYHNAASGAESKVSALLLGAISAADWMEATGGGGGRWALQPAGHLLRYTEADGAPARQASSSTNASTRGTSGSSSSGREPGSTRSAGWPETGGSQAWRSVAVLKPAEGSEVDESLLGVEEWGEEDGEGDGWAAVARTVRQWLIGDGLLGEEEQRGSSAEPPAVVTAAAAAASSAGQWRNGNGKGKVDMEVKDDDDGNGGSTRVASRQSSRQPLAPLSPLTDALASPALPLFVALGPDGYCYAFTAASVLSVAVPMGEGVGGGEGLVGVTPRVEPFVSQLQWQLMTEEQMVWPRHVVRGWEGGRSGLQREAREERDEVLQADRQVEEREVTLAPAGGDRRGCDLEDTVSGSAGGARALAEAQAQADAQTAVHVDSVQQGCEEEVKGADELPESWLRGEVDGCSAAAAGLSPWHVWRARAPPSLSLSWPSHSLSRLQSHAQSRLREGMEGEEIKAAASGVNASAAACGAAGGAAAPAGAAAGGGGGWEDGVKASNASCEVKEMVGWTAL